jgi:aspartate kinase
MRVVKFGGSSVANAERILGSARIVAQHRADGPVTVVVSALAGVTDALLRAADAALAGRHDWRGELERVEARHRLAYGEIAGETPRRFDLAWQSLLAEADRLASGEYERETAAAWLAAERFSGWGERLVVDLFAQALTREGLLAQAFPEEPVLLATARPEGRPGEAGPAVPSLLATRGWLIPRLASLVMRGGVPLLPGYIALDAAGRVTTLGRNGSDLSASVIGAALGAHEVYIYSDVAGIYSADPRLVLEAQLLPEVTYAEAAEIAELGARVLHPRTVEPLGRWSIPLRLRSSLEPDAPGTDVLPGDQRAEAAEDALAWVVAARPHPSLDAPVAGQEAGPQSVEVSALVLGSGAGCRPLLVEAALAFVRERPRWRMLQIGGRLSIVVSADESVAAQRALHAVFARLAPRYHSEGCQEPGVAAAAT